MRAPGTLDLTDEPCDSSAIMRLGPSAVIFAVTATIFLASPVRSFTDSRYSVLVSEALLRHGSFVLDEWFSDRVNLPYQVETVGGHVYYWYPPGGPVLATPFVWLLARVGVSAVGHSGRYDSGGEHIVQSVLAACFMALLAVFLLRTAWLILPPPWSWILALSGCLGTQIWSTASRALWGDTFLVLILGAVVWLLVAHETGRRHLSAPLLATLLSWGFFARPTASIPILAITLYVARHHRALLASYLATGAAWCGLFVSYSWLTFGSLLPSYYRINRFSLHTFGSGLLGILVSPSRGQLIFVPVTLFVAYLMVRYWRSLPLPRLVTPAIFSVLAHIALISAFDQWHGGHSYGPRYLTPLVPWLVLLAALGLRTLHERRAPGMRIELAAAAVLLAWSVLVQARGAWAQETWTWNKTPNDVSLHPERIWNWLDAQPLAGLLPRPSPSTFPLYVTGNRLDLGSDRAKPYLLSGWSRRAGTVRWTAGQEAALVFGLEAVEPLTLEMELEVSIASPPVPEWSVIIQLNGTTLETLRLSSTGRIPVAVRLPPERIEHQNRLTFRLRDPASASPVVPGGAVPKREVAVHWLRLRRAE